MEIRNLLTFIHVAELNSFTKAAQALDYSQSTVSIQIKQLETELDCLLFERINHTLKLTDKGQELLAYAHQMCQLMDEFDQNQKSQPEVRGSVHIISSDSIVEQMLLAHYIDFRIKNPGIKLKFSTGDTSDMFDLLSKNEADIMFTLDRHVYNQDYVIVKEQKADAHFVVGCQSPLAARKTVSLRELVEEPFYLTEKNVGYRPVMDEALAKMGMEIQPVLEISRTDIMMELLAGSSAVSLLPDFVTEQKVREGSIVRLQVPELEISVWKQLIHHKNKWISRALDTFIQYVCENEFDD